MRAISGSDSTGRGERSLREEVSEAHPDAGDTTEVLKEIQAQIADLQTKFDSLATTVNAAQDGLRDLLWQTREQLLRRSDEIQGTIYELGGGLAPPRQPSAAMLQGPANGGTSLSPQPPGYTDLVHRVRRLVSTSVEAGSTVIVISRGDERLLEFDNAQGWHFPQAPNGVYAGFHPRDSKAAIKHLEELRSRGGDYFLLPATAAWWLDFYHEFREHLECHYSVVAREQEACVLYSLAGRRKLRK